jgi:hypothetical protein
MIIVIVISSCVLLSIYGVTVMFCAKYYKWRSGNTSELREWISRDGGGTVHLINYINGRSLNIASVRYENEYPSAESITMDSPMDIISRKI